ncbi:hypothetical protein [Bdellovibrio bacteriovorus]|uniref:hypothetical protein n=1 Tax=Bdellovibrio TaxID=958 RepID=UPI0035A97779
MQKTLFTAACFSLVACATTTDFKEQQSPADFGYRIEDTSFKDTFYVHSNIKEGTKTRYIISYVGRVVGETCMKRGYKFFDSSTESAPATDKGLQSYRTVGFCYPTAHRKDINVLFAPSLTDLADGAALGVEDAKKTKTKVRAGDVLKLARGKRIRSMLDLKEAVRMAARKNEKTVEMVYLRKGKVLKIKEPLRDSTAVLDSGSLANFKDFTE